MRRGAIRDLPFRHNLKPGLGVEVFSLADLVARVDAAELASPQRPEFHTLYLGLRGRARMTIDFTDVALTAGTLLVVARGRVQQFAETRNADAWLLLFSPDFIALDARAVDPLRGASVLDSTWPEPALQLPAGDRVELVALAEQIAAEQARPLDAVQPALMASLLRALLLRAERLVHAAERPPAPPALQRFFTMLERDCLTTRSVTHYAKGAGLSPRRLAELLVAHTGRSTKEVIDDRVVLEQKRLLAHTDISVKELATRTGFEEPTNLVKFFRQRTGTTPQEFRRNLPSGRSS